jgi:hypothetical protein
MGLAAVVAIKNVGRLDDWNARGLVWTAPDDSPLFARDISTEEIYALDVQWP